MELYTVVDAADCDGGMQVVRIERGEDCCAASRRAGGICHHGAGEGGGDTYDRCQSYISSISEPAREWEFRPRHGGGGFFL